MTAKAEPQFDLDALKALVPLPPLIRRHVELSRSGNKLTGCCPFHDDTTPSFTVYDNHFHCFGCGAHGDAIDFVSRIENMTFIEARDKLALEFGIDIPKHQEPERVSRPATIKPQAEERPDWMYQFFADRHIGARTVNAFGCYATTRWFTRPVNATRPAIVYPYKLAGTLVNRKYRAYPEKQFTQESGSRQTIFNIDALGKEPTEIVWVEGEADVLAMHECGYPHTVSLKDGASPSGTSGSARFEALRTHSDILGKATKIILAGDNDPTGLGLREELSRRLGRHKVWLVKWPDGCKDACDVLRKHGLEMVQRCVGEAEPYPIDGLYRVTPEALIDLYQRPKPKTMTSGTRASNAVIHLPAEGRLITVTGFPNHGKTAWVRFVMVHTAKEEDRRWLVFSPEHQPWEQFAAECAEVYAAKPFWPIPGVDTMTRDDILEAGKFFGNKITMMVCDAEGQAPTLDWILERAVASVLRDGTTDLLVDPWNEIEHVRSDMSETEYTGRCLQRFKAFGLRHGCNVWIVAHPAKPPPLKSGEKHRPPNAYDISGSANWNNKTDMGITVWAPEAGGVDLILWKSRFRRWGTRGSVAKLEFDQLCGTYRDPVHEIADPIAGGQNYHD